MQPPELLADPALQRVLAALPEARLVGGCVRDALIGLPVADIDLATPRPPSEVMSALNGARLRVVPTGLAHGTVTAIIDRSRFEITTLRRDVETDGRRARVAFTDDWQADAARRDFTFNAMSMSQDGVVHDYFGGRTDLSAGRVRFVGDPATRIAEDRLRLLRFFRFFARYGRVPPTVEVEIAIADAAPGIGVLSEERVWGEMRQILAAPDPRESIALMARLGVLAAVIPQGADPGRLDRLIAAGAPADPLLRLAALLDGDAASFAARLKLSGHERDSLLALREPPPDPKADDLAVRRLLADTPAAVLIGRCWLAGPDWTELAERLSVAGVPMFPLEGQDVLALGIAPGPRVGELLRQVRAWWLAGGCLADAAACRAELQARLR